MRCGRLLGIRNPCQTNPGKPGNPGQYPQFPIVSEGDTRSPAYRPYDRSMHILLVQARVKPEFIDAFKQATAINAGNSAKEPGVARFDFLQQQDDPSRFVLYEVYRDSSAPAQHKQTAHYLAWAETVSHMFQEPRTRAFFTNVFPAGDAY